MNWLPFVQFTLMVAIWPTSTGHVGHDPTFPLNTFPLFPQTICIFPHQVGNLVYPSSVVSAAANLPWPDLVAETFAFGIVNN